jgi:hypothetical protein
MAQALFSNPWNTGLLVVGVLVLVALIVGSRYRLRVRRLNFELLLEPHQKSPRRKPAATPR